MFLDVGQGDATLVQIPDGRAMLVDAGGIAGSGFDIGERVLAPALRAFGVRTLDTLVLTHGDPDHIGGAPSALRRFGPGVLWEGVPVPPHVKLRELETGAVEAGAVLRTVQAGDRERDGPMEIRVLHPPLPGWERQRVRNEDSVVLELRMGAVSIVLPGDIGAEGERAIVPSLALGRDCRDQSAASRQCDLEHGAVRRGRAPGCGRLQRRPGQPVRPPGPDRRRSLSRRRRRAVPDGRRWRGDDGH